MSGASQEAIATTVFLLQCGMSDLTDLQRQQIVRALFVAAFVATTDNIVVASRAKVSKVVTEYHTRKKQLLPRITIHEFQRLMKEVIEDKRRLYDSERRPK
ncbi:hypothetical protein AVEN_145704-1 [Araneus ventricosus]|uniref:Uncharacterized protein n=1 Tax=Araneus ventricosus TaxID=182803 RepID=A0A4Y2UB22_ARAVE|nr:hypothetical protein AVEN_243250-1 [Araneus ventricosus]GBO10261.1 hypothetical protein AVEN_145704-1 [Araneus ventricosus]